MDKVLVLKVIEALAFGVSMAAATFAATGDVVASVVAGLGSALGKFAPSQVVAPK